MGVRADVCTLSMPIMCVRVCLTCPCSSEDCSDGGWQWRSLWQWQWQWLKPASVNVQRPASTPLTRAFLPPCMAMSHWTLIDWSDGLLPGLEVSPVGDRGFPEGPTNIGHADDADDDEDGG
jgi:hypothetical protein